MLFAFVFYYVCSGKRKIREMGLPEYQKKILLIQLRQLGDIILSTPCIREIRRELPKAHITFLCHKMGKQVLEGNPYVNQVIYYHENDSYTKFLEHFREIRSHSFDLVFDFMNDPRSGLFSLISKGKKKVSTKSARKWIYHQTLPRSNDEKTYIVDEKFNLLRACGFSPQDRNLDFPWFEEHLSPVKVLFSSQAYRESSTPDPIRVVLSPTHRRLQRKWPLERYCQLAEMLVSQWNAKVTWIWGPGEEAEIDRAITNCSVKTFKAPPTSFKELAALIANHHFFVGNSNGPSHLAIASDICSLQLHGHTKARSWCPFTPHHQAIQSDEFGKVKEPSLNPISVEEVWRVVLSMKPEIEKEKAKQQNFNKKNWSLELPYAASSTISR